ncbi:MAG: hypothetical protein ACRERU_08415 [Methylococcales bacterium]
MRLALGLEAISPSESHLDFRAEARSVRHGCTACHRSHRFDTRLAAVNACLGCHSDEHSLAFDEGRPYQLHQN